MLVERLLSA